MNSTLRVIALVGLSIGLRTMLVGGLSYGLRTTLVGGSSYGLFFGLSYGLIIGLSIGLSFWLLLGLFQGVSSETIGDQHRVVPNQGIRRSAFNSLVLGFISAGIVGLLNWLSIGLSIALGGRLIGALTAGTGLSYGLDYGLRTGLITGLSAGLLAGLLNGGLACLRYSVIRLLLWRSRVIPWNYPRFLDYAAEHILLRKVGGGYIFLHRLLLDYFANLENGTSSAAESRQERPSSDTKSSKSAEPTGANEHSIVPTAPLASPIILSEGSRLLPCGHEQRAPNAHFCSVCGAPIT